MPEGTPVEPTDVLGVDLGIAKIAVDSTCEAFSGEKVEATRKHYARRRAGLNRVGTKSARRRLSKIRKREANFRRSENHRISKQVVAKAKATGCAIAIEDLNGIRDRVTVKKPQRNRHASWSFNQLRSFLTYKATLAGIVIVTVDPRDTSRTCSVCGHREKASRKSQAEFECRQCSHSANADFNSARNIRVKAFVKVPMVGAVEAKPELRDCG